MKSQSLVRITLLCVCLVGLNQFVQAQSMLGSSQTGVPSASATVEDAEILAATSITFTGKLVFSFTITISSTLPTTDTVACEASASLSDVGAAGQGPIINELAAVAATRSGSTATCTVNIPYSWSLINSSTDAVQLSYVISVPTAAITGTNGLPARVSTRTFASIKVPASGMTTTETIKATI